MTRTKGKASKVLIPIADASPRKRRKGAQPVESNTTLLAINQIKEQAKHKHKHAQATRKSYDGYVARGQTWLKTHFSNTPDTSGSTAKEQDSESSESLMVAVGDAYEDPAFREALEKTPNRHSDKALALLISYKCFHEDCGMSTCEGLSAAFKKLWEEVDGDTFRGKWHYNDVRQRWEGNPVCSAEVQDIIKSVRHKTNSDGGERTHSVAMSKSYLIRAIITGSDSKFAEKNLTLESRTLYTKILMNMAFSTTAWNLWTRCFELIKLKRKDLAIDHSEVAAVLNKYLNGETLSAKDLHAHFKVFLSNRKGWQRKVDKGVSDLRCNRYNLYPQPNMPSCDCFFWLLLWLTFLEFIHYGRPLDPEDYVFPTMSTNGIVQPREHISHDAVQGWINEATTAAGIPHGPSDSFTTHTYRRGGAQWRRMFAPIGQRWTLARVRWWGSWAENENPDMLIRYLLDELHSYESDHSDALCPTQREADGSLIGEHTLTKPACTQDLLLMQDSITADVAGLRSDVCRLATALTHGESAMVPTGSAGSFTIPQLSAQPHPSFHSAMPSPPSVSPAGQLVTTSVPSSAPIQALSQITNSGTNGIRQLPEQGLVIPAVPAQRADGSYPPRKESWRQIVRHWLEGDPTRGLHLPLRDWPADWIRGKNKALFASKYKQRAVIALEFLDRYNGNETLFLAAYPEANEGHTGLLRAINHARKMRGELLPRNLFFALARTPTHTTSLFFFTLARTPHLALALALLHSETTLGQ
ncbi:uncharacterized protein F5891DRAFT_1196726 [Suillus fuscotomentosus]|uniref:Uncharacterized protein n=1 Tax=Suillus fuscotomentosus TaxID=1912939 RepID=A0AAD4DSM4_9AGAM|nr:uncharacterized protein F5891DRAFT_1196726 [Suillus fuscotomentosus]KAG1893196.1 hypothetical protein F5891DRAFT_1196726 [Suillus fuscotomentosus]